MSKPTLLLRALPQAELLRAGARAQQVLASAELDSRHGHITPLPGGFKARCGGPPRCSICQAEQAALVMDATSDPDWKPPTAAQAAAGNYYKPRMDWHGLKIVIENPAGTVREGVDETGRAWRTVFAYAYGEIAGTTGWDGDPVDVFIGPYADAKEVYIVRQMKRKKWSTYDEDKCMIDFPSIEAAREAYLGHYDDPRFFGGIVAMPLAKFIKKVLATKDAPAMIKGMLLLRAKS